MSDAPYTELIFPPEWYSASFWADVAMLAAAEKLLRDMDAGRVEMPGCE